MDLNRRNLLALGAALPLVGVGSASAQTPPDAVDAVDAALLWRTLFAAPPGEIFSWWFQGMMFAHVDRLREFPVAGLHAILIGRTTTTPGGGTTVDFRTIGYFSDLATGLPTATWRNVFTDTMQDIPPFFIEGPGQYTLSPGKDGPVLALTSDRTRTNRAIITGEITGERAMLTQIEGTLQGFPNIDGTLPPLGSPAITERQTRIQIIAPRTAALGSAPVKDARGYFSYVYDALPGWMGFGEALGSGLSKGELRKADAMTAVNRAGWDHLRKHVPSAFSGNRLVLG